MTPAHKIGDREIGIEGRPTGIGRPSEDYKDFNFFWANLAWLVLG